jgi:hypothetical protein
VFSKRWLVSSSGIAVALLYLLYCSPRIVDKSHFAENFPNSVSCSTSKLMIGKRQKAEGRRQRFAHAFVSRRFSGVFIRGFPPNKKTTRQRIKTEGRRKNKLCDLNDLQLTALPTLMRYRLSPLPTPPLWELITYFIAKESAVDSR